MKTLAATLLISAFAVAPAMACGFGKMAEHKTPAVTASAPQVEEQAMSTFDPAEKPAFEATEKVEKPASMDEKSAD
ncbi:MAG: hypothetical protein AAGI12_11045 [Pseudomonadota bacterium]